MTNQAAAYSTVPLCPLLLLSAFQLLSPNHNSLVAAFAPPITTNHKIINTVRSRGLIIQSKSTHKSCEEGGSTDNLSSNSNTNNSKISADTYTHHIALKTRNIENAIKFYSLLGFHVETKFISGPAKCAWLIHSNDDQNDNNNAPGAITSRIELIQVPAYMLNEPEGMKRRALDLTKREELLGLNHFALDVTANIPRSLNEVEKGTSCEVYQLKEWMDDLNQESIKQFGRSLRVALQPTKRIIGREVYEMAFLYDADGALVELLNHCNTLKQEVDDGWEPWDGPLEVR